MRVLVTTTGSAGHFGPMIPFVDAAREAGAEILVATRESTAGSVRAAGYEAHPYADAPSAERGAVFGRAMQLDHDEANALVVTEVFAGMDARAALPGVQAACERFRPDVVLHEAGEFAGRIVAARAGIPRVCVGIGMSSMERKFGGAIEARLRALRAELRIADGEPPSSTAYFTLTPPALEDPSVPAVPDARRFREHGAAAVGTLRDRWDGDDAPLVYFTLGSVAPTMGYFPGLYRAAIDALADLPVRLLVTTGHDADPADLGALPANVHAERWIPQASIMPAAAAMVCHGGFGTVRAGLAAGVPQVVLPLFADQPYNARRVAGLRAGIALEGGPAAVAGLREAVLTVLADRQYAARARVVADEIRMLPTVDTAAEILRELAAR